MKTAREVLMEARRLIDEKGWTQNTFARDKSGEPVVPDAYCAVCFCSTGAIARAAQDDDLLVRMEARRRLRAVIDSSIPDWNDNPERTKDQVLAAFDQAIERA